MAAPVMWTLMQEGIDQSRLGLSEMVPGHREKDRVSTGLRVGRR